MEYLFDAKLTTSEMYIAKKIYNNIDMVVDMGISELAEFCQVSPSKITKYSNKIGFKGFKELKVVLNNESKTIISGSENFNKQKDKISELFDCFDQEKFKDFIKLVNNAETIILYGDGPSLKVCQYFAPRLRLATMKTIVLAEDSQMFNHELNLKNNNKLLILVSASGKTDNFIDVAINSQKFDCKSIIISEGINPNIVNNVDLYINLLKRIEDYDTKIIRGRTLFLIYLELLVQDLIN